MFPYQGTSMATPIAAGVGALLVSFYLDTDGEYDLDDVVDVMADTATDKGDSYKYGAGIINAGAALTEADSSDTALAFLALLLSGGAFFVVRKVARKV